MKPLISVIVCSTNDSLRTAFYENVKSNIGVGFEFLYKDNNKKSEGICKVYNDLATIAKGDYVCFVHEDIIINSKGWGALLVEQAQKNETGIIGFAGSTRMSNKPFWYNKDNLIYYFVQRNRDGSLFHDFTENILHENEFSEVAVLDGMFLFCRREVWELVKFDDCLFNNFHMYDMDFSFAVAQKFKNYVSRGIIVNHYSLGHLKSEYYNDFCRFYLKWRNEIPFFIKGDITRNDENNRELIEKLIYEMKVKSSLSLFFIWKFLYKTDVFKNVSSIVYAFYYILRFQLAKLKKNHG